MTDETKPTPAKKRGRPPRVATTPQDLPVAESKPQVGTPVPAEPENATQGLPTISVEELVDGMDASLVMRVDVALARHMIKDHRMTWGETRISLGYGLQGQDDSIDSAWVRVFMEAQK